MASFVVMESPDRADAAYVRDGFHFFAFLLPPVWLAWHRLWVEAAVTLAVMLGLGAVGTFLGLEAATPLLSLLVSIYVGLEAPALRIAALRRRGWHEAGVVDARNWREAEIRHLYAGDVDATAPEATAIDVPRPGMGNAPARLGGGPALGLLSYPGAR